MARLRFVTLVVVAADDGQPPRTDTLRVHLMAACVDWISSTTASSGSGRSSADDDGGLRFVNATYHVTLSESTPVGATLLQVRAVAGRGRDDAVTYRLLNLSAMSTMFAIDPRTGELLLRGLLVPGRSAVARLTVTASSAAVPLPVYADVIVHVGDRGRTAVIVLGDACDADSACRYAAAVSEDVEPQTLVATVFIHSRHPVTCSTMTSSSSSFELRRASDDATAYRLLTASRLDRELRSIHQLSVVCRPLTRAATTTTWGLIDVTVDDINDNRPEVVSENPTEVASLIINTKILRYSHRD